MTGRRRVFFKAVATAAALFLWAGPVLAQGVGGIACFALPCQSTVASLPTPDGTQGVRVVLDASTATDCTVGGGAEVVLCMDTGVWEAVASSGGTDDQTAVEVPYTPTVPSDWTDPDPTEVLTGLDDLAARLTVKENETLAGDVTGPVSATVVGDDTHAHTTTTVSGLDTSDVTTGAWADARVSQSSVTQHQAALSITESQVSDLAHFAPAAGISTDHGTGAVATTTDLAGALCGTGEILEDQGAAWACIATPAGGGGGDEVTVNASPVDTTAALADSASLALILTDGGAGGPDTVTGSVAGVDLDGDGVLEVSGTTGSKVTFDPNDDGTHEAAIVAAGATVSSLVLWPDSPGTGMIYDGGVDWLLEVDSERQIKLFDSGGTEFYSTWVKFSTRRVDTPQTATCTDSGDANPGSLTLIPTNSNVELTVSDADGCDVTISETGALPGQMLEVSVVSIAGGTANFADAAGIQEMGTGCSLPLYGTLGAKYVEAGANDRWIKRFCETDV